MREVYTAELADLEEQELCRRVQAMLREQAGKSVINTSTNWLIELRWQGIKHATAKTGRHQVVRLHSLLHVEQLLTDAVLEGSAPDKRARSTVIQVHTFKTHVTYQGVRYRAYLQVREVQEDGHAPKLYYDQYVALEN